MSRCGAVRRNPGIEIRERHLGLVPANEESEAEAKIALLAETVVEQVDLDRLMALAAPGPPPAVPTAPFATSRAADLRIAVARDAAFGFYYPDDLEAFAASGAQLVPFDTLHDQHLPDVDGLFIGGGFPEVHMAALSANRGLRASIKAAIEGGLPAYAECGGLMYLARSLTWRGETREMVGIIPGDAVMNERPVGRGYVQFVETGKGAWPLDSDLAAAASIFSSTWARAIFSLSTTRRISPASGTPDRPSRTAADDGPDDLMRLPVLSSRARALP